MMWTHWLRKNQCSYFGTDNQSKIGIPLSRDKSRKQIITLHPAAFFSGEKLEYAHM